MSWATTHLDAGTPPRHFPEAEGHEGLWRLDWRDGKESGCVTIFLWLKDGLWRAGADHDRSRLRKRPVSPLSPTPITACSWVLTTLGSRLEGKTALVEEVDMAGEDLLNAPLPQRHSK